MRLCVINEFKHDRVLVINAFVDVVDIFPKSPTVSNTTLANDKNHQQTMAMMGITFNIHALCFFAAHGLSGAASTRVGNDLGAGRPHMAWLTVQV